MNLQGRISAEIASTQETAKSSFRTVATFARISYFKHTVSRCSFSDFLRASQSHGFFDRIWLLLHYTLYWSVPRVFQGQCLPSDSREDTGAWNTSSKSQVQSYNSPWVLCTRTHQTFQFSSLPVHRTTSQANNPGQRLQPPD